jgi:tetratricopeptide (TPR) repeat protein
LRDQRRWDEAIACCKKALAIDPHHVDAHVNLGNALRDTGKVEEAIASYNQALTLDSRHARTHCNLGLALQSLSQVDRAIECYRRAIVLDPRFALAHSSLGLALASRGKVDEAIACYQKALEIAPELAHAHNGLGAILCDVKRDYPGAIVCFRKAIASDPRFAPAHINLGVALKAQGKMDEAIACFQRAIVLDPTLPQAHDKLGLVLVTRGKTGEAIACWRKAVEVDPRYANGHFNLGVALKEQGEFVEARLHLRRCLDLLPSTHPLRAFASDVLARCRQSLDADARLKSFLTGKKVRAEAGALVQMAFLAQQPSRGVYYTATCLYREAFAQQPRLADAHRYDAARAAALAGTGQGNDSSKLDDGARAEMRYSAFAWLQDDLSIHASQLVREPVAARRARQALLHCQKDADLAAVRDPISLARLPEAEQVAWQNLWAHVKALLARSTTRK